MPHARRFGLGLCILALGFVAAQAAVGSTRTPSSGTGRPVPGNGSFERSLHGWVGWNASLARVGHAAAGRYAVRVTAGARSSLSGGSTSFALSAAPKQVGSSIAGATYTAAAKVRSNRGTRTICVRIREWSGGTVSGSSTACVSAGSSWVSVGPVAYVAAGARPLDAYIFIRNARPHDSFDADAFSLTESPPAPAPISTTGVSTTAPVTTTAPPPPPTTTVATTTTTTTTTTTAAPPATCTKVASAGADVTSFLSTLSPGQTGCLHGGTYAGPVSIRSGGQVGSPISLTSYPGERARIVGRVVVFDTANDLVVSNIDFDGNGGGNTLPSPTIDGDRVTFVGNDVTNDHTAICFDLGSVDGYGTAVDVTISGNRIHDCGKLPAQNHDHGIYVEKTRNAHIIGNTIVGNADRGIQLYPDAQGSLIEHNTIVGNGSGIIISGDLGFASSDNTIRDNVIANSVLRYDVESWWSSGNPIGVGNAVTHNCIWGGADGTTDGGSGYTVSGSVIADPQFTSAATGDYTLRAGSPCASLGA